MKVKDVFIYVKLFFNGEKVMKDIWLWLYKYNEKYIQIGSIKFFYDVMLFVGIFGYVIVWFMEFWYLCYVEEVVKYGKEYY